jgi:hypothetical protein
MMYAVTYFGIGVTLALILAILQILAKQETRTYMLILFVFIWPYYILDALLNFNARG